MKQKITYRDTHGLNEKITLEGLSKWIQDVAENAGEGAVVTHLAIEQKAGLIGGAGRTIVLQVEADR